MDYFGGLFEVFLGEKEEVIGVGEVLIFEEVGIGFFEVKFGK